MITVAGSENIYSVLPSTVLEMLPMSEARIRIDGEPILGRHTMALFGLAADHDEQQPVQADTFSS